MKQSMPMTENQQPFPSHPVLKIHPTIRPPQVRIGDDRNYKQIYRRCGPKTTTTAAGKKGGVEETYREGESMRGRNE